jgi:hypothetical protein
VNKKLSRDAVLKMTATDKCREIPDGGAAGLRLVIQPKPTGAKSWAMRFRRPNGKSGNLQLGPFDRTDREAGDTPIIGQPLIVPEAHALAAAINLQRARGIDVVANHRVAKQRQGTGVSGKQSTFPTNARDFIDRHVRPKTRRWRETARMLGYKFPLTGDAEPTIIKGGLAERWRERLPAEIDGDDLYAIVQEAVHHGIPGLEKKAKGPSNPRGRKMADALGTLFGWLQEHRRIKTNPTIGVHRPGPPPKGTRVLNIKPDIRYADELRWFWRACDQIDAPYGPLCKLLLLTGCRVNEIARMEIDELSTDNVMLSLPGERTKNHLPHLVPLPSLAREIIDGVPRISNLYIFSTTGGTPISGFSKYKKRLDALMLAEARKERGNDFVIPKWKLHDLRRTMSTGMNSIGVHPHIVEACLNHISGAAKAGVAGVYNQEMYLVERIAAYERWATCIDGIAAGGETGKVVSLRR